MLNPLDGLPFRFNDRGNRIGGISDPDAPSPTAALSCRPPSRALLCSAPLPMVVENDIGFLPGVSPWFPTTGGLRLSRDCRVLAGPAAVR